MAWTFNFASLRIRSPRARSTGRGAGALAALVVAATLVIPPANAAPAGQIERDLWTQGDSVHFRIRFRDADRDAHLVSFALPATPYEAARDGLVRPDGPEAKQRMRQRVEGLVSAGEAAWRRAMRVRLDALQASLPRGVRMSYRFEGTKLRWNLEARGISRAELERIGARLRARITEASRRLQARRQRNLRSDAMLARDALYQDMHYVRDPGLGDDVLRPDYPAIARDAAALLRPLAEAIAAKAGALPRARIELALAFLQSIPYDRLTGRDVTDGIGFAVPAQILHLNRGDCDSKATALAALLGHLAPGRDSAMLLLPGHAVLAIDLPPHPGDRTINLDGRTFVLSEPAGPAILPIGQVGDATRDLLEDGKVLSVVWM